MIYIHTSALVYHGNLKSSNCVVTSRWVLQVTDFGLHDIRNSAECESVGEHQQFRSELTINPASPPIFHAINNFLGLLWKAPELLRDPHIYGSQKSDVYAFSIILYEIIGRRGPYGPYAYEPKEIIELVKKVPEPGEEPFRPDTESLLDMENVGDYVINCIKDCWDEQPENRPDFPSIRYG